MDIEEIRDFCLSLKGSTEDLKWGGVLCFTVENKIFLLYALDSPNLINVKIDPEYFDEEVAKPGISQAFHMAKRHWISIHEFERLPENDLKSYILNSRSLVIKKLSKAIQQKYL
ncbi:MmcQ/YjbR family DNA-binding protein [Pedobacter flavus]|uniref:MmcQ/YjbR family DNA-binding protein n=1 Tax=Pedobacter flavus TaxID=3113906 RepID=A0ABU7H1K8_9SPHI|nr:MmcQ/YjbR family DNA-binding protein [Pedobacter sp. VNH31]MEE1885206.1 MmcQ/YjbR family DNA-binding protein [Pedobacter sp. VNH31]